MPTLLVGLFGAWTFCGPALLNPTTVAATSREGEGPGHLWGLWLAALDLPVSGGLARHAAMGWPGSFASHLMDPVNLLLFLPGYFLGGGGVAGATLGWNLLHAAAPLVGAWSAWRLSRRLLGDHPALPWAAMLGALALVASPYFLLQPQIGRSEYLPALLYPAHLAFFHQWMRRPGPEEESLDDEGLSRTAPTSAAVGAALTLGAIALGGWYVAVFAALANFGFAVAWSRGLQPVEAAWRLAAVAIPALILASPAAWALLTYGAPVDLSGATIESARCQAVGGLVRTQWTGRQVGLDFQPYIGLLPLAAMVAQARRGGQRAWLGVGGALLLFGCGPALAWTLDGAAACGGLPGPLSVLTTLVPPLRAMRSVMRINCLVSGIAVGAVVLSVAELWGKLGKAGPWLALGLAVGMVADHAGHPSAVPLTPPTFDARLPAHLVDAVATLPMGPIVTYPTDATLRLAESEEHGLWGLWQLQIGRPVSAGALTEPDPTESWNALSDAVSLRVKDSADKHGGRADRAAVGANLPLDLPGEGRQSQLREGAAQLMLTGYAGVVLAEDMEGGGDQRRLLRAVLGEPCYDFDGVVAWNLHDLPQLAVRSLLDRKEGSPAVAIPEGAAR